MENSDPSRVQSVAAHVRCSAAPEGWPRSERQSGRSSTVRSASAHMSPNNRSIEGDRNTNPSRVPASETCPIQRQAASTATKADRSKPCGGSVTEPVHLIVLERRVRIDDLLPYYSRADGLAIDNLWQKYIAADESATLPVLIDLSHVRFIAHDCLLFLTALVRERESASLETFFELPSADNAWNFIRSWKFPECVQSITGRSFEYNLAPKTRERYLADRNVLPQYTSPIDLPGGGTTEDFLRKQFQLMPLRLDLGNPLRAATFASAPWMDLHMRTVLDVFLRDQSLSTEGDTTNAGDRVGSTVVMEAVLNAAMHPAAKTGYITSQIVPDNPFSKTASSLEIGIWDDGTSIADTLRERLSSGGSIFSDSYGLVDEIFEVELIRTRGRAVSQRFERTLHSSQEEIDAHFPWLTVAAFFAGVSAIPERSTSGATRNSITAKISDDIDGRAGMGLRYIRRHVLDLWDGEIRYWSGHYRMSMTKGNAENSYRVVIQYRPESSWPLQGNLLMLSIPLRIAQGGKR